jgi:hypothetical protein
MNKVWEDLLGFGDADGRRPLPDAPEAGPGFEVSEDALKRYPSQGTRPFLTAFHEDACASICPPPESSPELLMVSEGSWQLLHVAELLDPSP